jgi:hypothetical protein
VLLKTDPAKMTRDASNWAIKLDLQKSKRTLHFNFLDFLSRHDNLTSAWFAIGAQQLRADQLRMLDDV